MSHTRSLKFFALAALAAAPIARSNAQSLSIGLMAGASLSTFTGDLASDVKNYAGFIAGGFIHAGVAGFAVEPGLYYTRKGSKSDGDGGATTTNQLDYVQVPLVIKVGIPFSKSFRIYVGAGPAIGVNIGCKFHTVSSAGTEDDDCSKNLGSGEIAKPEKTELSAIGVAGIEIGKLSIGVRGDYAVSNSYKSLVDVTSTKPDLKTRTLSAIVAYRLF